MRGIHRRATSPALLRKTTPAPNHPTTAPARAQAGSLGLDHKNADGLKNFNKNKKLIKKFGAHGPQPLALFLAPFINWATHCGGASWRPAQRRTHPPSGRPRPIHPAQRLHPHNPHYPPRL